jgi:hypothetical protein
MQIITGHVRLGEYMKRFHLKDNENCNVCSGKVENFFHVLFECGKYNEARNEMRNGGRWSCIETQFITREYFNAFDTFCLKILETET